MIVETTGLYLLCWRDNNYMAEFIATKKLVIKKQGVIIPGVELQ
jgi:hypothetical protein